MMGIFNKISALFSGTSSQADACTLKALEIMTNKTMDIDRVVAALKDLNFTFDEIKKALPRAAAQFFALEHERIEKSKQFSETERKKYLDALEKRKIRYLAKLESVF